MTAFDPATVWAVVVGVSVVTYALRSSFILGIERIGGLPPSVEDVLPYVPVAVLAALLVPALLVVDGGIAVGVGNERLIAGLVAVGVAVYTESLFATVGVGMAALWALLWVV